MNKLPIQTKTEVKIHNKLVKKLKKLSKLNDNWVPFSVFMETVLYDPEHGYYIRKQENFGELGDFITAPMISDFFAQTFLKQFYEIFKKTTSIILEIGPGNGFFCRDILQSSEDEGIQIDKYYLMEIGVQSKKKQKVMLKKCLSDSAYRKIKWVKEVPDSFSGVVFMNELLDALPVDIFKVRDKKLYQKGLSFEDQYLTWSYKDELLSLDIIKDQIDNLPEGYIFEHSFEYEKLIKELNAKITKGAIFIVDYGFANHEYFHPDRSEGTLMCHYRHFSHSDPLINLGSQDITSHVNFSYLAELCNRNNFLIEGFLSQANFLINSRILDCLNKYDPNDSLNFTKKTTELQKLLSPAEMGDLFKVMVLSKNIDIDLGCSQTQDKSFQL